MANQKLTDLTGLSAPVSGDKVYVVDVSDTTDDTAGSSRVSTLSNLSKGVVVTNLDVTGLTSSELLRVNSGGSAIESAGVTLSGSDATAITGTAGTDGDLSQWNADGDLVDGPTPPSGTIVGTTDTQTLTNKTLTSPTISSPTVRSYGGWVDANESWTYSSWDDTNGVSTAVITVPSDATTKYQAGMRVMFDQTTDGTKYGIITKVESTALTVFLNTDYDFDNESITSPYYSSSKTPFGFSLDPLKYIVETANTGNSTQASPTASQWYNLGSLSIDIPVGAWDVHYQCSGFMDKASAGNANASMTLSTANNSESDSDWTTRVQSNSIDTVVSSMTARKPITLSTKDTYYLNGMSDATAAGDSLGNQRVVIRAVCAYL